MYDHYFSNFGRPPVPNDICKDSATIHPQFWRFLKVFTIYGHGGHLCQWTATIFSNLSFPCPREAPNGATLAQRLQRRSRLKFWTFFLYKCIGKQTWPCHKKVKCQCTTIILAILVDLPSPMMYAKIQPQGILGSGEDFKGFYHIWDSSHLGQQTATIFVIFRSPKLRRLRMKFEQNWQWGQRSPLKMLTDGCTHWQTDDGRKVITTDHLFSRRKNMENISKCPLLNFLPSMQSVYVPVWQYIYIYIYIYIYSRCPKILLILFHLFWFGWFFFFYAFVSQKVRRLENSVSPLF